MDDIFVTSRDIAMKRPSRIGRFVVMSFIAVHIGVAWAQDSGPEPAQTVQTPGGEAIVARLNMGPFATALWKKIQALIANPEMFSDFSRLAEHLDLDLKEPIDAVDPKRALSQSRSDIKNKSIENLLGPLIESGRFMVVQPNRNAPAYARILDMVLAQTRICITDQEVERVYGPTERFLGVGSHGVTPTEYRANPVGLAYSMAYPAKGVRPKLHFSVNPAGCVSYIQISQSL